jgi:hypothetical protein
LAAGGERLETQADMGPKGSEGHHLLGMAMLLQSASLAAELFQEPLAQLFVGSQQLLQFGELGAGLLGMVWLGTPLAPAWALDRAGKAGIGRAPGRAGASAGLDRAEAQGLELAEADRLG